MRTAILSCVLLVAGCGEVEYGVEFAGERLPVIDMHPHPGEWANTPPSTQEFLAGRFPFPQQLTPAAARARAHAAGRRAADAPAHRSRRAGPAVNPAGLPHSPAAERNREPILQVLCGLLPPAASVLEVASGTGQHAAHFPAAQPGWTWQPTEAEAAALPAIAARCAGLTGVRPPLPLDVMLQPWPLPKAEVFDADLRSGDPAWGLRRLAKVADEARRAGLALVQRFDMPANNPTFYQSGRKIGVQGLDARDPGMSSEHVHYRGVFDDKRRLMMVICWNTDTGEGWEQEGTDPWYFREFSEKYAYPLGINIIFYALTH